MASGIYCIRNLINDKRYIGSAVDLYTRQASHFSDLKYNKHKNVHLQRAYNKYGKDSFVFTVLESVSDVKKLLEREQWWMDNFDGELYNMNPIAGSVLGHTWKLSDETKAKQSVAQTGNTKPYKSVAQIDLATGVIIKIWDSPTVASETLGFSRKSIYRVCQGKRKTTGGYKWEYTHG